MVVEKIIETYEKKSDRITKAIRNAGFVNKSKVYAIK